MREVECVAEIRRTYTPPYSQLKVWHIATKKGRTVDWAPIRCAPGEGIALPGPTVTRQPTCETCMRILAPSNPITNTEQDPR